METHHHSRPPRGEVVTGPLRTDEEIISRLDELIDPDARRTLSLWLFFLDRDGQQMPVIVPLDEVPEYPDPQHVGQVCWIIAKVLGEHEPDGSAVIALTRPGPAVLGEADRYWHRLLRQSAADQGASVRIICLATPEGTRRLSPGDES